MYTILKSTVITLCICVLINGTYALAQQVQVMKVGGNLCVGSTITFALAGVSCSSVYWYANGGTIISQNNNSVSVKWTFPTSNAWVEANYSSCTFGSSGFRTSPTFSIEHYRTPSVSITAQNVYPSNAVTFTASPVNGGSEPHYTWFLNEAVVGDGTSNTLSLRNLVNQDAVKVRMTSVFACSSPMEATSNSLVTVAPVGNAGPDIDITLPNNSITLHGSGSDADGSIAGYTWRKISGPTIAVPLTDMPDLTISNLTSGVYIFRLIVIDNMGTRSLPDLVTITVNYPPNNYNWVKETTILVPNKITKEDLVPLEISRGEKNITWSYFDGFGRPMQTIKVQNSPLRKDIVYPFVYDEFNREALKYLPFADSEETGTYKMVTFGSNHDYTSHSFYDNTSNVAVDNRPFSEVRFDQSPLNRPLREYGPGEAWAAEGGADKYIEYGYFVNTHGTGEGQEKIIRWELDESGTLVRSLALEDYIEEGGYYSNNQLSIKSTKDEHGNEVRQYLDKSGRVVLKKVYVTGSKSDFATTGNWAETYYIYDDFGNLIVVLPPEAVKALMAIE